MQNRFIKCCLISSLLSAILPCNSAVAFADATPSMPPPSARSALAADPFVVLDARQTLTYLASDECEGRGVGTHGIDLAADYIAKRFEQLGLRKLPGEKDYFQRFDYKLPATLSDETSAKLNGQSLALRQEFIPAGMSATSEFAGDVVFVGYGVSEAEKYQYDDYDGIDVTGKVALAMRFEPRDEKSKSRFTKDEWSTAASLNSKARAAAKHGAKALILVNPFDSEATSKDNLISFTPFGRRAEIPVIQIKQSSVDALLKKAGAEDLRTLQTKIDSSGKPASMALQNATASVKVVMERKTAVVKNVMAMLPGAGPHANEYIVVGAHYDHLGRGLLGTMVPGSHDIHHGADDNGSGTTAVIELAGKLVRAGRLSRSVIFITFTAEEEGLIGSDYFVNHPPVPLSSIASMLNMDMVGRVKNEVLFIGGSGTSPPFELMLKEADAVSPLDVKFVGPMVGAGGMGPSDHQSFAMKKIPVLFFFSGLHSDYHTPTDTSDKINYEGLAQSVEFAQAMVNQMALITKQDYVDKYDSPGRSGSIRSGVSLGVIPDYAAGESSNGVPISGTRPESAASKAGLQAGDIIVQMGDMKIDTIYDLTDALGKAKPGQTIKIAVMRKNQRVEMQATLGESRGEH